MSQRSWGLGAAPAPEPVVSSTTFSFRIAGESVEWDWDSGPPPWRELQPVRIPKARALSRHVPAMPFCWTTGTHLVVESGLEHDLLRDLDRCPEVTWLVTQPMRICLPTGLTHVPDILEIRGDALRVWDVRPKRRQDEAFHQIAARSERACAAVGMKYSVFSDDAAVRRSNLRWLSCYRAIPDFAGVTSVLNWLEAGRASTVGDLLELCDADGEVLASLWHLIWRGDVEVDLDTVISDKTALSLRSDDE